MKLYDCCMYFDEDLVRNQDDEMSYRLRKNGYKIYRKKYLDMLRYFTEFDLNI